MRTRVVFKFVKSTKNMHRYEEIEPGVVELKNGMTFYVRHAQVEEGPPPTLYMYISEEDEEDASST